MAKSQIQISVIIPTYNRAEWIGKAVESVAAQKLPKAVRAELWVVDDGGRNRTRSIVESLARKYRRRMPIHYLWQENAGPGVARNLGAKQAHGKLLAFLDDDAVADPSWLAAAWAALKSHSHWDGCEGAVVPISSAPTTPFYHQVSNTKGGQWLTCNLFVKRGVFLNLGGFDPRYKWIREHTEFAFRALETGKILPFLPAAVVRHPAMKRGVGWFFGDARHGRYEALLEQGHPESYRKYLKWTDGRAFPAYYWPSYAAVPLGFICPGLALASLALGFAGTMYAWFRKRRVRIADMVKLAVPALIVPFLRLYWVAYGYWKYPHSPE